MRLRLITPPAEPPVTVPEAKAHLRVEHSAEDALIGDLVGAATAHLDGWTGVLGFCLEPQEWELRLDGFPCGAVDLPIGPVTSVESIEHSLAGSAAAAISAADLILTWSVGGASVSNRTGWPEADEVVVRFIAGSGTPAPVRQAILMLAAHWYMNREAVGPDQAIEVPLGVAALIAPFRRVRI